MPAPARPGRPTPRAAVVSASGEGVCNLLRAKGMQVEAFADPYSAAVEVFRRPLAFRVVVLSLRGVYREELSLIGTLRRRLPHVEVWLAEVEGRSGALATAVAAGASALLDDEGLHRFEGAEPTEPAQRDERESAPPPAAVPEGEPADDPRESDSLLSADELRALLHDEPAAPPIPAAGRLRNGRGSR